MTGNQINPRGLKWGFGRTDIREISISSAEVGVYPTVMDWANGFNSWYDASSVNRTRLPTIEDWDRFISLATRKAYFMHCGGLPERTPMESLYWPSDYKPTGMTCNKNGYRRGSAHFSKNEDGGTDITCYMMDGKQAVALDSKSHNGVYDKLDYGVVDNYKDIYATRTLNYIFMCLPEDGLCGQQKVYATAKKENGDWKRDSDGNLEPTTAASQYQWPAVDHVSLEDALRLRSCAKRDPLWSETAPDSGHRFYCAIQGCNSHLYPYFKDDFYPVNDLQKRYAMLPAMYLPQWLPNTPYIQEGGTMEEAGHTGNEDYGMWCPTSMNGDISEAFEIPCLLKQIDKANHKWKRIGFKLPWDATIRVQYQSMINARKYTKYGEPQELQERYDEAMAIGSGSTTNALSACTELIAFFNDTTRYTSGLSSNAIIAGVRDDIIGTNSQYSTKVSNAEIHRALAAVSTPNLTALDDLWNDLETILAINYRRGGAATKQGGSIPAADKEHFDDFVETWTAAATLTRKALADTGKWYEAASNLKGAKNTMVKEVATFDKGVVNLLPGFNDRIYMVTSDYAEDMDSDTYTKWHDGDEQGTVKHILLAHNGHQTVDRFYLPRGKFFEVFVSSNAPVEFSLQMFINPVRTGEVRNEG